MRLLIEISTGKFLTLEADSLDTIFNIKKKIEESEGIFPNIQVLVSDRLLEDNKTLVEYNIGNGSKLFLLIWNRTQEISVTIKMLTGRNIDLSIEPSETISTLKQKIEDFEGIPHCQQNLIFEGLLLEEDEFPIEWYNIQDGSTIYLRLNFRGC